MKEGAEGRSLQAFLEELVTGCLGSESDIPVKVLFDYRTGYQGRRKDKCRNVLVSLTDWPTNVAILHALWDKPNVLAEGQELPFFSDLSLLTLKKEKGIQLLDDQVN